MFIFKYICDYHDKHFVIRHFRAKCSSVEMLKGYMLIFRNAEGIHTPL